MTNKDLDTSESTISIEDLVSKLADALTVINTARGLGYWAHLEDAWVCAYEAIAYFGDPDWQASANAGMLEIGEQLEIIPKSAVDVDDSVDALLEDLVF